MVMKSVKKFSPLEIIVFMAWSDWNIEEIQGTVRCCKHKWLTSARECRMCSFQNIWLRNTALMSCLYLNTGGQMNKTHNMCLLVWKPNTVTVDGVIGCKQCYCGWCYWAYPGMVHVFTQKREKSEPRCERRASAHSHSVMEIPGDLTGISTGP